MNPANNQIGVVVIGCGQQGIRTIGKLKQLCDFGIPISLLAVVDPQEGKLQGEILPGQKINDLFPEARLIPGLGSDPGLCENLQPQVVFDCSNTVHNGADNHVANMWAALNSKGLLAYGVEKPAGMSKNNLGEVLAAMKERGIPVIPHAVESLTRTKQIVREDIQERGAKVKRITCFRLSATQTKSVQGKRLILVSYGGAWRDKAPHDVTEAFLIVEASEGTIPNQLSMIDSRFEILEIRTPDNRFCRVRKDRGTIEDADAVHAAEASESHARVLFQIGSSNVTIAASHLGAQAWETSTMASWFFSEIRQAVAEAAKKHGQERSPETIMPYYGVNGEDLEARISRVECRDGSWYLTQTFAKSGGPFAARVDPNGSVTVLDYNPTPYDGHLEWVRNVIDVARGEAKPAISSEVVTLEAAILEAAETEAMRHGTEELDLRDPQNGALAEMLKTHLPPVRATQAN